jgi:hypothetical protein
MRALWRRAVRQHPSAGRSRHDFGFATVPYGWHRPLHRRTTSGAHGSAGPCLRGVHWKPTSTPPQMWGTGLSGVASSLASQMTARQLIAEYRSIERRRRCRPSYALATLSGTPSTGAEPGGIKQYRRSSPPIKVQRQNNRATIFMGEQEHVGQFRAGSGIW